MEATARSHRWKPTIAGLLGLGLIALGCGTDDAGMGAAPPGSVSVRSVDEQAGPPQSGGTVVFGLNAETDGFNPAFSRWAPSSYIVGFSIMDPLMAYDDNLVPQPYLAKSLKSNADFTEWTIGLRPDVKLHDGKPVDAALVKRNLDAQKSSGVTGESLSFVQAGPNGVTAPDPLTVVVHMTKPWSTFPHILTAQIGAIADEKTLGQNQLLDSGRNPVGSGPFILDQWTPNKNLVVRKNPNYWRKGYPHLDSIDFRPIAAVDARGKAFEAGDLDIFETSDPQQILSFSERAKIRDSGVQIFTDERANRQKIFVAFNTMKPPFDDPLARQAVVYATNNDALSTQAYQGVFPPAYSPFDKTSPFYVDTPNYPRYDLEKAKQLAKQYEQKHGRPIEFSANILPTPEITKVAEVLQDQQKQAGITVHLKTMEQLTLIVDALLGNYQATGFILFGSPHIDREYVFFASPPKPPPSWSLNLTRFGMAPDGTLTGDNKRTVEAMDKARTTTDLAEQRKQYAIVQEEMAKHLYFGFLVAQTTAIVSNQQTHGALDYKLPNAEGGDGAKGMETAQVFTFNLWLKP